MHINIKELILMVEQTGMMVHVLEVIVLFLQVTLVVTKVIHIL